MSMSYQNADIKLNADLQNGTPYVWLHTATPGAAGTAAVAKLAAADIVRKAATFGAAANHAANTERTTVTTVAITLSGAEIDASQSITHFSIWSAVTVGTLLYLAAVGTPKTTGSDGVTIAIGDLEVAISVFVKP